MATGDRCRPTVQRQRSYLAGPAWPRLGGEHLDTDESSRFEFWPSTRSAAHRHHQALQSRAQQDLGMMASQTLSVAIGFRAVRLSVWMDRLDPGFLPFSSPRFTSLALRSRPFPLSSLPILHRRCFSSSDR